MKVGILTFPHSPSFGAMLQMGSLYHMIESMGHDVEIVNYVSSKVNHQKKSPVTFKTIAIWVMSKLFLKSSKQSYQEFEYKLKMFPEQPITEKDDMTIVTKHFDRIIVGSDQVWNPIVTGHDLNFYLAFCNDSKKKASYAASFGYMKADEKYIEKIGTLLNDFKYLSVREKDGQKIIKQLTGRNAELVLDPTLLVSADYLRSLMKKSNKKKNYVLFFCVKPSNSLYEMAKKYAKRYEYELVTIGGRIKDRFNPKKHPIYGAGPKEFIGLIDDAQCVFTNSFHGMAVSIALHREFFVEYSSDTNSRLINLIEMTDLKDRVIKNILPQKKEIDYVKVDEILQKERSLSLEYLNNVLQEPKDNK